MSDSALPALHFALADASLDIVHKTTIKCPTSVLLRTRVGTERTLRSEHGALHDSRQ